MNDSKRESSRAFHSARAPEPVGAFPHARRVGNLLFLSGMGPRVRGSATIPGVELDEQGKVRSYDIETQCRAVFDNVRTVLEDAGSRWENIVDVTVFLTSMEKDFPVFNRLYAEAFADSQPTRTTIEVGSLPTPIAVELKVIATVDEARGKDEIFCPRCRKVTKETTVDDATVHACTYCSGMFLHRGQLNKIAEPTAGDLEFSTIDLDSFQHEDAYGPLQCPQCDTRMHKVEFNIYTNIILDYCRQCGGFWLDGRELDRINEEVRRLNEAAAEETKNPAMLWFARFIWSLPR
jgi:2-aminomuconate deaminase